jgi:uncharacterized membrane protein (UPF0136 family)
VAVAAPALAVEQQRRAGLPRVLVYWHLLSLDAPTVAVLWAWGLAHAARVPLPLIATVVLGLGAWIIYVADRLLDGRTGNELRDGCGDDLRERHFFHARHRRAFLMGAGCAGVALLALVITAMASAARRDDAAIFGFFLLYFLVVHLPGVRVRFPRELAVGIVFASACVAPAWSRPGSPHAELVAMTLVFAALCWLNCTAIHVWEHDGPASLIPAMALCVAVAAGALAWAANLAHSGACRLDLATLASALLLLALDRDHRGSNPSSTLALRVLADAALLTPLLFVVPWRI